MMRSSPIPLEEGLKDRRAKISVSPTPFRKYSIGCHARLGLCAPVAMDTLGDHADGPGFHWPCRPSIRLECHRHHYDDHTVRLRAPWWVLCDAKISRRCRIFALYKRDVGDCRRMAAFDGSPSGASLVVRRQGIACLHMD